MIKLPKSSDKKGRVSLRLLLAIAILGMLPVLLWADNNGPTWWRDRGIQNPNKPANDYAAVNQGQLKNFAAAALAEMDAYLPVDTEDALHGMVNHWATHPPQANDYAAVNLGQLKNVAKPFYDRLLLAGYQGHPLESGTYPWTNGTANNYAMANIGQVKNLFSFDLAQFVLTIDTDGNGLPDSWENQYFGHIGISGTSIAPRNDGLTVLDAFEQGLNPIDFYNGEVPMVTVVSGTNQYGDPDKFLPNPLLVQVSGSNGVISNAPVLFLMSGGGGFASGTTEAVSSYFLAKTDSDGKAQVFFQLPPEAGRDITITAGPGSGSFGNVATFVVHSNGIPVVPTILSGTTQIGGFQIEWTDNHSSGTSFDIERTENGGNDWILSGTTGGTTSYLDTTGTSGIFYIYRVSARNQFGCSAPSTEISIQGTDPEMTDSDGDGIPDAIEVRCGTNPLEPGDESADTDGDGYPNIYEYLSHFDPRNPNWTPPADFTVDLSGANGADTSIQAAINKVTKDYQIISVNPGTYTENLTISAHKLLLISSSGAASTIIDGNHTGSVLTVANDSVVNGFTFTAGSSGTGGGVFIQSSSPRITNCVIVSNSAALGAAVYTSGSAPTFLNCTIANNTPTISSTGEAIANVSGSLTLINSIVWNPSASAELSATNSVNVSYCDVRMATGVISGSGNLNTAPMLTPDGHLCAGSPCIGSGTPTFAPQKDMDSESRIDLPEGTLPDIGADQFVDNDTNLLPDWWETKYFENLGNNPNAGSACANGATLLQAYQTGLNPLDYYAATTPVIAISGGNNQTGDQSTVLSNPLTVTVKNSNQNPLVNAPITFAVVQGGGQVINAGSTGSSLTLRTNGSGVASVQFKLPDTQGTPCRIMASAASDGQPTHAQVTFTESSNANPNPTPPPTPSTQSSISTTLNADGSVDVTWQNPPGSHSPIPIEVRQADGTFKVIATVPAGTTSYHIPAQ